MKTNKILWIGISLFILIGVFSFLAFVNFSSIVKETYTIQEPYEVQESYEVKEPYEVQKVYIDNEDIKYKVLEKDYYNYFWTSGCNVWVIIQNIDDASGYFSVNFDVKTSKGDYKTTSNRYFLASGSKHTFLVSFEGDYKKSNYDINVPSKEVTKIKTITEWKTIKKWRTVTKYKPVTKYRDKTIYCTILEKLTGKCLA